MKWFLHARTDGAMVARTLAEVVLGWFIANIGDIFNLFTLSPVVRTLVMGLVTVVATEVLAFIREKGARNGDNQTGTE